MLWGSEFKNEFPERSKSFLSKNRLRTKVKANLRTIIQRLAADKGFCCVWGKCKNGPESILLRDDKEPRQIEVFSVRFKTAETHFWNGS